MSTSVTIRIERDGKTVEVTAKEDYPAHALTEAVRLAKPIADALGHYSDLIRD